ncbi:MAG: GntR family transcriptional regulator [Rhodospirillaceae bacterium]|nr:GntR family transcriptional regulator [Rhodospirillaceae bacterium]
MTKPCQGPEAALRPQLVAPAGACDCHAHVLGPLDAYPYQDDRAYTAPPALYEDYRAMLDTIGIDRAVIVQPSVYGTDNRCTLQAIARDPARMRGVAVFGDDITDAELQAMHDGGIRGVRFNLLFVGGVGLDSLEVIAARIARFGWHIQLLIDYRTLPDLADRLAGLPVDIVVDHMGHMPVEEGVGNPGFQALLRLMSEGKSWVKVSGNYRVSKAAPAYADAIPFAQALLAANPDRCVWGSDWPHVGIWPGEPMPNDADLLDALLDYAPDEALRRRILVDNPARLYGFD